MRYTFPDFTSLVVYGTSMTALGNVDSIFRTTGDVPWNRNTGIHASYLCIIPCLEYEQVSWQVASQHSCLDDDKGKVPIRAMAFGSSACWTRAKRPSKGSIDLEEARRTVRNDSYISH